MDDLAQVSMDEYQAQLHLQHQETIEGRGTNQEGMNLYRRKGQYTYLEARKVPSIICRGLKQE